MKPGLFFSNPRGHMLLSPNDESAPARAPYLSDPPVMFEWQASHSQPDADTDAASYLLSMLQGGRERAFPHSDHSHTQAPAAEAAGPDILFLIGSVYAEVMGAESMF